MSVIIKDMEMPEDCRDCPMEMYYMNIGETRCRAANKILADNYKAIPFDGRPDWCPLIELPPHGRLIDADKLMTILKGISEAEGQIYGHGWNFAGKCINEIENAPTVIEAEEE